VRHLRAVGHEVEVVVLEDAAHGDPGSTQEARVARLRETGAAVHLVPSRAGELYAEMAPGAGQRLRRAAAPSEPELFPQLLDADAVAALVRGLEPDVAYVYHWEALAASRGLRGTVPRLATVVDLPQLSALYRWRRTPGRLSKDGLSRLLWLQGRVRRLPPLMVTLLNECEASGNFAAHHAAWLRRRGARDCQYFRTPIDDLAGPGWRSRRRRDNGRPRILLIGHLRGISTLEGLDVFAAEVLPRLEQKLAPDGFEVRIAGGYEAPEHFARAFDRPSVRLLGHLEEPAEEFEGADALLVPTSIPLGTRVRILSAWSFGCPVVAHESNAQGIPELAHDRNALLARGGDSLADAVLRLVGDSDLQARHEDDGRRTYEDFFAPAPAAGRIEETLLALAGARDSRVAAGASAAGS
jgi:glycosyltransferase involved in cell wall biosynthesis